MEKLLGVQQLIKRSESNATQNEEYAAFLGEVQELERVILEGLRMEEKGTTTQSPTVDRKQKEQQSVDKELQTKVLFKMKHQNKANFLSGQNKKEVVASRKNHISKPVVKLGLS